MTTRRTSSWLVIWGGALVGLVLVACAALAFVFTGRLRVSSRYRSNGEQIYFTAASRRGETLSLIPAK